MIGDIRTIILAEDNLKKGEIIQNVYLTKFEVTEVKGKQVTVKQISE